MAKNNFIKLEELIDKKILFINHPISRHHVTEGKVNELSPSKNCIKINHEWFILDNIRVIEVFTDSERPSLRFAG
jgi:hypothetical protein